MATTPLFDDDFLKKLEYLHIVSKRVFAGRQRAERRAKKVGSGLEFADHREYSRGDDLRYVDWNVYGRLGRLLLRLFEEDEDLSISLLLDCSRSMAAGRPPKFDHARRIVAALAYVGLANLDRVGLVPFSGGVLGQFPPARGKGRIFKVLRFLEGLEPAGVTDLAASVRTVVPRQPRRGLAVVVSDLYDPGGLVTGLNLLRYHRFETYLIHVHDEAEGMPVLRGDLRLVDCETGRALDVTVTPGLLRRYAREHAAFLREVDEFCRSARIPVFRTPVQQPFEDVVLRIFRAGGFLA